MSVRLSAGSAGRGSPGAPAALLHDARLGLGQLERGAAPPLLGDLEVGAGHDVVDQGGVERGEPLVGEVARELLHDAGPEAQPVRSPGRASVRSRRPDAQSRRSPSAPSPTRRGEGDGLLAGGLQGAVQGAPQLTQVRLLLRGARGALERRGPHEVGPQRLGGTRSAGASTGRTSR